MSQQWEYVFASGIRGDLEHELAVRGKQGWEAVGLGVEGTLYVVLLKRLARPGEARPQAPLTGMRPPIDVG